MSRFLKLQFSTASILIAIFIVSLIFVVEFYEARSIAKINANVDQSIAGSMIIDFLKQNGDRWPTQWEDLKPYYLARSKSANKEEAWTAYKKRVRIDFSIDTEILRARCLAGDQGLLVVQTNIDPKGHEKQRNPNLRIYEYLCQPNKKP